MTIPYAFYQFPVSRDTVRTKLHRISSILFDWFDWFENRTHSKGLCKMMTGWWRMADGGWRMADGKMRMIKCGWQNADEKMQILRK